MVFVTLLENIVPWMFSLGHIHYARWLPLFLEDLKKITNESSPVLEHFNKEYLTVNKTDHLFQVWVLTMYMNTKQAIVILENETVLLELAVAGPVICDLLNHADRDIQNPQKPQKHPQATDLYEKNFRKDRNSFLGA